MYMRKHHKRTVQSGGATLDGNIPFPLMTKGGIFIRCRGWFQGEQIYQMQRIEADLSDAKDRGILSDAEEEAWFQGEHE
jgi:hypothetical protein